MIFFGLLLGCFLVVYVMPGRRHRGLRDSARIGFGLAFAIAGLTHLLTPTPFVQHIPTWVPGRLELVYATGVIEMLGGAALAFWPHYKREIAVLLTLYLLAVFPGNIYVAIANIDVQGQPEGIYPWIRLPFQALFIWWVLWSSDALQRNAVLRTVKLISVIVPLALLLSGCGGATEAAPRSGSGSNQVTLVADSSAFEPDVLKLPAGAEVTVKVDNRDGIPHDFVIESMGVKTETIEPGSSVSVTFVAPDSPTEFVCTFHPDMKGGIDPGPTR
jgi:uncharacterized membrane protein/plastocyanin